MEPETLVCPFCGAPHREVVPAEVVHVKCRHCGGIISVPQRGPRCPNHPNVMATNSCSDCGQPFCSDCLSAYYLEGEDESGVLQLCSNCLERRDFGKIEHTFYFGLLLILFGVFAAFLFEPVIGVLFILFIGLP